MNDSAAHVTYKEKRYVCYSAPCQCDGVVNHLKDVGLNVWCENIGIHPSGRFIVACTNEAEEVMFRLKESHMFSASSLN